MAVMSTKSENAAKPATIQLPFIWGPANSALPKSGKLAG
jgi:hypothetical protein